MATASLHPQFLCLDVVGKAGEGILTICWKGWFRTAVCYFRRTLNTMRAKDSIAANSGEYLDYMKDGECCTTVESELFPLMPSDDHQESSSEHDRSYP